MNAYKPPLIRALGARWPALIAISVFLFICWSVAPLRRSSRNVPTASSDKLLADIQNQTLGFERIFAVSLPSRTDHRDSLTLASAFTGLKVDISDGVDGKTISDKVLAPGMIDPGNLNDGFKGSWRAHLNVLEKMVREGISTALVIEDDADFDLRIRTQLTQFALATRILSQPLAGGKAAFVDPTFPTLNSEQKPGLQFTLSHASRVEAPTQSPYGDNWDVLWFGHCAARFPNPDQDPQSQLGRVVISDDPTVPQWQYFSKGFGSDEITKVYPNHTRVVHHTAENACILSYAVSQRAARRILYQFGIKEMKAPLDIALRGYCDGADGRPVRNCYTAQPQYFEHFRPKGPMGSMSDINYLGDGYNDHDYSPNIRLSARGNLEGLSEGLPMGKLWDQYPDVG